ncbi:MAG: hypothetical protein NNA21_08540 [Nitrospira sp.]|nr:hypothetical protein [Nitrospira sp.]MCP9474477.1 hypothetical protein [Nitrospira sp.]
MEVDDNVPFDHTTGRLMKDQETEWDAASPHFAGGAVPTFQEVAGPATFLDNVQSNGEGVKR